VNKAPFIISKILTDNGKEFTDRYTAKGERELTGEHPFDQVCKAYNIEHRLTKPRHPQTNGMVERFNGRISVLLATTRFISQSQLEEKLHEYLNLYNHHIVQKNLGHISPVAKLKGTSKNPTGRKSEGRGLRKTTCNSLIKPLPSGKKIKSGTLKTSKARFLEAPCLYRIKIAPSI
jgi:hypothetical protein